jgi:hypothetical protein
MNNSRRVVAHRSRLVRFPAASSGPKTGANKTPGRVFARSGRPGLRPDRVDALGAQRGPAARRSRWLATSAIASATERRPPHVAVGRLLRISAVMQLSENRAFSIVMPARLWGRVNSSEAWPSGFFRARARVAPPPGNVPVRRHRRVPVGFPLAQLCNSAIRQNG